MYTESYHGSHCATWHMRCVISAQTFHNRVAYYLMMAHVWCFVPSHDTMCHLCQPSPCTEMPYITLFRIMIMESKSLRVALLVMYENMSTWSKCKSSIRTPSR